MSASLRSATTRGHHVVLARGAAEVLQGLDQIGFVLAGQIRRLGQLGHAVEAMAGLALQRLLPSRLDVAGRGAANCCQRSSAGGEDCDENPDAKHRGLQELPHGLAGWVSQKFRNSGRAF